MTVSVPHGSEVLRDYFTEALGTALSAEHVKPEPATTAYLVNLLCEFAERPVQDVVDQPVALLERVGDHTLYVSGFFSESLSRWELDRSYYLSVGRTAYIRLSALLGLGQSATQFVLVFEELGSEFPRFADVLAHVREQSAIGAI